MAGGSSSGSHSGGSQLGGGLGEEGDRWEGGWELNLGLQLSPESPQGSEGVVVGAPGRVEESGLCPFSLTGKARDRARAGAHQASPGAPQSWGSAPLPALARGPHPGLKVGRRGPWSPSHAGLGDSSVWLEGTLPPVGLSQAWAAPPHPAWPGFTQAK